MKKSSNLNRISLYFVAFLLMTSVSVSCKDKKTSEKEVSKVAVSIKVSGGETLAATISDKSVIRFKVDSTLYGVAISNIDLDKKNATIAFLEADQLEDGITKVPKDKIKVVADQQAAGALTVETNLGVIDVQLNDFSVGSFNPNAAGNSCCVTCGNTTACGCAVTMSCGSCCVSPCCGSGSVTLPTGDPKLPEFEYF